MRRYLGLLTLLAVMVHLVLSAFLWMPAYYSSEWPRYINSTTPGAAPQLRWGVGRGQGRQVMAEGRGRSACCCGGRPLGCPLVR